MTDDIEERPVPCSVQLHEATSRIADLELELEREQASRAAITARCARLAAALDSTSRAREFALPDDIKKDITQSIGGDA